MARETFQVGDLTAVIGDNEAADGQRAGYNGIHSLVHKSDPTSIFVPGISGMNLEHIFDGDQRDTDDTRKIFFEPRHAPMRLKRLTDFECELHQPPTPTFHLESWTHFKFSAPHSIDFSFRCRASQHAFRNGYIGLFWANYINGPEDLSLYFQDKGRWQQLCTQQHNDESTVLHRDDKFEPKFHPAYPDCLYKHYSPMRFTEPFCYGVFRKHVLILMFDRTEGLRITHSPSGGGDNKDMKTTNPAWDFQYLIPKYEVNKDYGFRARVVYRERCSRDEIVEEYRKWKKSPAP